MSVLFDHDPFAESIFSRGYLVWDITPVVDSDHSLCVAVVCLMDYFYEMLLEYSETGDYPSKVRVLRESVTCPEIGDVVSRVRPNIIG